MEKLCVAGIDLTNDYVQLSYAVNPGDEPVSLSISPEEKKYLIPPALYYREDNDTWYIGDEALYNSSNDKKNYYKIAEYVRSDAKLLSVFFQKLLEVTERIAGINGIDIICVTVEESDLDNIKNILTAFKLIGYNGSRIRVINHDEAFIYYTINQKKELWVNDVALFDFTKDYFKYRRIHETKAKNPPVLSVWQEDLSDDINYGYMMTEAGRRKADSRMLEYIQREFKKHIVCTTFLTGVGFYDDWAVESLQEICARRRVFKGYNLFVKGACYAALKKYMGSAEKINIFQCSGRTKADVGLLINNQGKNMVISLSCGGTNWYEAGAEAECILDNVSKINLVINAVMDGTSINKSIDLSEFPVRPNKTTRVKISLGYKNDDTFDIVVRDMGFGELFKSSGRLKKETISISKLFNI